MLPGISISYDKIREIVQAIFETGTKEIVIPYLTTAHGYTGKTFKLKINRHYLSKCF
ncbi:hypothetical protein [Caldisericum exile]|uniref:Uncharacterized protein n=1 Tax=Caldisericum exile (strain DSM 21853 / NBRC 104410 / AZM16c01) TaxID=511051 RepID=A0A7U6GDX5_CALEA|nr:hypothetical protein [Caldisericum exile]BAL80604.1 hypothetical protein CSE_04780 [Caldisericum exile AZM16c01]